MSMKELKQIIASGLQIKKLLNKLGHLRVQVFRDFPYLYDGSMEYEGEYLELYVNNEDSYVFAVFDGDFMVGATTAIPLKHTTQELKATFEANGYNIEEIMYFGESVLLKEYRGQGIGHLFFDKREAYTKALGNYKMTAFCSVDRPANHPLKPEGYQPNDAFWTKRGYIKQPNLHCNMLWKDIDSPSESSKSFTFWTKEWI